VSLFFGLTAICAMGSELFNPTRVHVSPPPGD